MRALLRYTILASDGCDAAGVVQDASVIVHRYATTVAPVMWDAPLAGAAVTNPLVSDVNGQASAWLDAAEDCLVDLVVSDNSGMAHRPGDATCKVAFTTYGLTDVAKRCGP